MADEQIKLPPGYTLEDDVKLPPGYSLEAAPVTDPSMYDNPANVPMGSPYGIPVEMGKPVSIPLRNAEGVMTPKGLDTPLSTTEKIFLSPLEFEKSGMEQLGRGMTGVPSPQGQTFGQKLNAELGSLSDVIRGGLQTATPFFLPEVAAHPIASTVGLGTFGAAQGGVETLAQTFGLPSESSRFLGDLVGMYGGSKVHSWLSKLAQIPDKEVANSIYRRLEQTVEALKDPTLSPDERAAGKAAVDAMLGSLRQEEGWKLPALFPNPNRLEREAYDYMRGDVGTAPNAGMATGSTFVHGAQKLSGYTPFGAYMDVQAKGPDIEALRARAARLISGAMPEGGRSGEYYSDFEQAVKESPAEEVPLYVDRDGSQVTGNVKVPVDIRDLKYDLQPLYDKMRFMPMADRSASHAFAALEELLKSNDHISAPTAEWGLSQLKKAARLEEGGVSEALAKRIIPQLQSSIDSSVKEHAGDDALSALQQGRAAAAKEAGAEWLADQFKLAQQEGGFGHEARLWNNWVKLKETAKRSMFNPQQVAELNKFFMGLRMRAANPNPSGTALVGTVASQATGLATGLANPMFWLGELGAAGVSKLLRSDFGVKMLTEGLTIPRTSERGHFIEQKLKQILGDQGNPPESGPPAGGEPGGGPSGPIGRNRAKELFEALKSEEGSLGPQGRNPAPLDPRDLKDIVQWGAAKLGQGLTDPRVWRQAVIAQFGRIPGKQLDEMYQQATAAELKNVTSRYPMAKPPTTRESPRTMPR